MRNGGYLRNFLSVRRHLSARILLATVASVMAVMSATELPAYLSERALEAGELASRAQLAATRLAFNLADPVGRADSADIRTTISHEMRSREVLAILVADPDGRRVGCIGPRDACPAPAAGAPAIDENHIGAGWTKSSQPIARGGRTLGTVTVYLSDIVFLERMRRRSLDAVVHTVLLSIVFSAVLFLTLRRVVIHPLEALEKSVDIVSRGNFHISIPIESEDEVGRLGASFNRMVSQVDRLYGTVRKSEEQLLRHTEWQQRTLEDERTRIAREIHDELSQQLTAMRFDLHWVGRRLLPGQDEVAGKIRSLIGTVDDTHEVVERIIRELRPQILDDLGLVPAIEWLARDFEERTGIPVDFAAFPEEISPPPDQATALFRIAQEALTNVARHAGAGEVRIRIRGREGALALSIRDDGRGFDPGRVAREGSHGLIGLRERVRLAGGLVKIRSRPGAGTRLTVLVPRADPPKQEGGTS
ncbi:MAG TPA: sensor histidine kinase [Candidatus Deferrimicrobiaceae bacterium]